MELEKLVRVNLDEEPIDTAISNKNIAFYDLDKNTAKFEFLITNKKRPLLVSNKNVKGYAYFKSQNKQSSGVIDLEFIEPLKGIVGITLPADFLKRASNTLVYGELYLSLNDANNIGKDDTVVLGRFTFKVKESLINEIDSDIKVENIKMFDDLRDEVREKINDLVIDVDEINEVVGAVQQAGDLANTTIEQTKNSSVIEVNKVKTTALTDVENQKESALSELATQKGDVNTAYELALNDYNANAETATNKFNENATIATQTVEQKIAEYQTNLENDDFVTKEGLGNAFDSAAWQKYALTDASGSAKRLTSEDIPNEQSLLDIPVGLYYASNTPITASASSKHGFVYKYESAGGSVKIVEFRPYNSNQVWRNHYYTSWSGWSLIVGDNSDTDWITLDYINGAIVNNAKVEYDDKPFWSTYRITSQNGVKRLLLRFNGSNVESNQVIAQLPSDTLTSQQVGLVNATNGYAKVIVRSNGMVNIKPSDSNWKKSNDFSFYGQVEFTL